MRTTILFSSLLFLLSSSCKKNTVQTPPTTPDAVAKPSGIFSSSGSGTNAFLNHAAVIGVHVRAAWKDVEPTEGNFNFTALDIQINNLKAKGKKIH